MAATRPIAVANSASAMPGATTASVVFFDCAMLEGVHDAPDRAEQADEGGGGADRREEAQCRSIASISRWMVTPMTCSMRWRRPARAVALGGLVATAPPFAHGGREDARHRVVGRLAPTRS